MTTKQYLELIIKQNTDMAGSILQLRNALVGISHAGIAPNRGCY